MVARPTKWFRKDATGLFPSGRILQHGSALAFLRDSRSTGTLTRLLDPSYTRIRCPLCGWQPRKEDRWFCDPGCGYVWNTFETAGVCPGCQKHWELTACLRCGAWSPHVDWYESDASG